MRRIFFVLFLKIILYFSEKNSNRLVGRGLVVDISDKIETIQNTASK